MPTRTSKSQRYIKSGKVCISQGNGEQYYAWDGYSWDRVKRANQAAKDSLTYRYDVQPGSGFSIAHRMRYERARRDGEVLMAQGFVIESISAKVNVEET
jgi:hypothetical protein